MAARADAWMAIEFLNSRGARPEFGPISGVTNDWSHQGGHLPLGAIQPLLCRSVCVFEHGSPSLIGKCMPVMAWSRLP